MEKDRKEQYLSNDKFSEVFGMSKDEFNELPEWRQQIKKRENNLF